MTDFASGFATGGCLGLIWGGALGFVLASILVMARGEDFGCDSFKKDMQANIKKLENLSESLKEINGDAAL